MYRSLTLLVGGLAALWAASLHAQDAILGQLYGRGVHTFFSRDYAKAHQYLTKAIDGGSKDPRTHYFRGMAYLKLGRQEEAEMDFQKGAELESGDLDRFYNVAKSLERLQGRPRLLLEDYRIEARVAARQRAEQIHRARYEEIRRQEDSIVPGPGAAVSQPPPDGAAPPPEGFAPQDDEDPFQMETPGGPDDTPFADPGEEPPFDQPPDTDLPGDQLPDVQPPFAEPPIAEPPIAEPPIAEPPIAEPPIGPPVEGNAAGVMGGMFRALGKAAAGGGGEPPAPDGAAPGDAAPADPGGEVIDPFAPGATLPAIPGGAPPEVIDPFAPGGGEPAAPGNAAPAGPVDGLSDPFAPGGAPPADGGGNAPVAPPGGAGAGDAPADPFAG